MQTLIDDSILRPIKKIDPKYLYSLRNYCFFWMGKSFFETYCRMPKTGILFTDICIGDFFNKHVFIKHWLEVMFTTIICEQKLNQIVDTSDCERWRRRRLRGAQRSSFHNLLLDHTNYVLFKGLKIYNRNMLTPFL